MPLPVSESFILAGIVSLGGLITVLASSIRQSRCNFISCCCFKCKRDVLSTEQIELEKAEQAETRPRTASVIKSNIHQSNV